MKTDQNDTTQAWEGDWEQRIHRRIQELGHPVYHDYLKARPGHSYDQMALELGEDVAPVQLARLHALNTKDCDRALAIVDSFARYLRGALKKGWGLDRYWETAVLGALSSWYVTWNSESELDAFQREVFLMHPEPGWIPKDSEDPILSEAAKRVWPPPSEAVVFFANKEAHLWLLTRNLKQRSIFTIRPPSVREDLGTFGPLGAPCPRSARYLNTLPPTPFSLGLMRHVV